MVLRRTGPEDAVFLFDELVSDSRVIGDAASRSATQFRKDFARTGECEAAFSTQSVGNVLNDPPVLPSVTGRSDTRIDLDDTAFDLRDGSLVLLMQRTGQNDIGMARRFAEKEVDGDK